MDPQNNVNINTTPNNSSSGLVIGTVVVLIIVVLGALYFLYAPMSNSTLDSDSPYMQSDSDETSDIETDLNATDVDNLDAELNAS